MENFENDQISRVEEKVDNTDYIAAIKELKQNSVPKSEADALKAENKKLLNALVNGEEYEADQSDKLGSRLDYYKAYKENKFSTDLDYWTNFLNLRKATIKEYGADPCVTGSFGLTPEGGRVQPAYGEQETIDEQLEIIEDFVKQANGNSLVFETLMQSAMPKR